jgi:hypothetical protein
VKLLGFHPDAGAELTDAAQYYEVREPGLGTDLLDEVERAPRSHSDEPRGFLANRQETVPEVLVAVPLQSSLRCLSRSNSNRSLRTP